MNRKITIAIIIVGIILLAVVGLYYLGSKRTETNKTAKVEQTVDTKTLSTQAIAKKQEITKTDKQSGDLSLADNENFEVDYLISNDDFVVIIKKNPYQEIKKLAEKYFLDQGFSQQELCELKIRFYPAKEAIEGYNGTPEDSVPTGCEAPSSPRL